ncbi:uncharacterized protein LOC134796548 [Cydia splendana]
MAVSIATEPVPTTSDIEKETMPELCSSFITELVVAEKVTACISPSVQSHNEAVFVTTAEAAIKQSNAEEQQILPEANIPECVAVEEVTSTNSPREQSQVQSVVEVKVQSAKRPQKQRKRLIGKLMNLTPTGRMIYDEYKKSKRQADFYHRAKRALKFNKEKSFQELTKDMNPYAKTILKMQINLCNKNKKGRRFSLEEKLIALSIMKQSPKCYRFLHKIFILPSRSTLNKMVAGLKIESGICPQVFEVIRREVCIYVIKS